MTQASSGYPRPRLDAPCPEGWTQDVWDAHLEERRWHHQLCSAAGLLCPLGCQAWPAFAEDDDDEVCTSS